MSRFISRALVAWRESLAAAYRVAWGLALLLLGAGGASAITLDDYLYEGSYGVGTQRRVAVVVDFPAGDNPAKSFAFEVKFDTDTINGLKLLDDIQSGTGGLFNYTALDYGDMGLLVNTISYGDGYQMVSNTQEDPTINYWRSTDAGASWTQPWSALGSVEFNDNDTLGWTSEIVKWYFVSNGQGGGYYYSDPDYNDWHRPSIPLNTPEPSAFALLIAGGLAALAWRWRRRV